MSQILLKRWLEVNLPTTWLTVWEPYFTTDTNKLFIANSDTTMVEYSVDATALKIANNLSDLNDVTVARTNLWLWTVSTLDTGIAAGNVPVLDWLWFIEASILPALAITSVNIAADETAQLAVVAQEWDVVIRTDVSETYIHNGWTAGTMADYTLIATPTDAVTSVAGKTGVVTLGTADITWLDTALWNKIETSVIIDEDTMVSNSATHLPTQQSVKAYVDWQAGWSDTKQVKVSANDTTEGYLEDKVVAGSTKVAVATLNDWANESVSIDITEANINLANCNNTTSAFLNSASVIDEDDMVSDSAVHIPTQQSTKAYVDNEIANIDWGTF